MKAPEKPQHLPTFYAANLPEGALADDGSEGAPQYYLGLNLVPQEPIESQFGEGSWYPINPPQTQAELDTAMKEEEQEWVKHKKLSDAAINYEQSTTRVYDRFRETVDATWATLTDLRGQYRLLCKTLNLAHMAQDEGVGGLEGILSSMPKPYANARQNFEDKFAALLALRDNPTTPFMVARMIDVDTSVYGSDDDTAHIIYEGDGYYDDDSDDGAGVFIQNPVVLAEMRRNDTWMNNPYSFNEDTKAESLRRKDELVMSRIHSRVDLVNDPTEYLLKYGGMYNYINDVFGLDVTTLPSPAKLQMIDYLTTVSNADIKRISAVANKLQPEVRTQFAEAFLATEHGDDFGKALLDIAEHTTSEQAKHIFETILQLRQRTSEFAHMFTGIDPEFAESTEKAMNERITDSLVALQQITVQGGVREDVAPHRYKDGYVGDGSFEIEVNSVDKAIEIIDGLEQSYAAIHRIITAADLHISKVNEDTAQFALYRLMSEKEGNMLLYVRPEGAYGYDSKLEYGNRKGVEASISFMVNPLDPMALLAPKDRDAVSLRFDREGRTVDEAPDTPERDPTRADGLISVDISSGVGDSDLLAVQIGRLIAAGNRIRAQRQGTEDSLHHNTNYLNQEKYGNSAGFADLAQSVIRNIELLRKTLGRRYLARAASQLPTLDQAA